MAWTTPRTWTASEVVTAAQLNEQLRDNMLFVNAFHGVKVFKSGDQTVSSGNNDLVTWNNEVFDTDGMHDNVTTNSRFTIPAGLSGYWRVIAKMATDADAANHNTTTLRYRKNAAGSNSGGTLLETANFTEHTNPNTKYFETVQSLSAGEYIELFFTAGGEARVINGGTADLSWMQAWYMGA